MENKEYVTFTARVSARNRIYIPQVVVDAIGAKEGSTLEIKVRLLKKK